MTRLTAPKNTLMLIAGLVWSAAGVMVSAIGLPLLFENGRGQFLLYPMAITVMLVFYLLIFSRLVVKHTKRIRENPKPKLPFWVFFDTASYVVMAIMMGGGILLRTSHVLPAWAIAFFYSGLGIALFSCGLRFLVVYYRKDVLMASEHELAVQAAMSHQL